MAPKGRAAAPKGKAKAAPKGKAKAAPKGKAAAAPKGKAKARADAAPPAPAKRKAEPAASAPPAKAAKGGGGRPVDSAVPNKGDYKVVGDWSVLLNQTNVVANNNKYYKIQILDKGGQLFCWTHWGRVGHIGQFKLEPCGGNMAAAEANFKSKFRQKSSVPYENLATHDWTPKVGKYTYVETEEQEGDGGGGDAPLGKLTVPQIEKGQGVLKKIDGALAKKDVGKMAALSSEFYTLIPHDFGFKVPPAITTREMLQAKVELLKFYLRMGFEEMEEEAGKSPVSGVMDLPLPRSLNEAAGGVCGAGDINSSNKRGAELAEKQAGKPTRTMDASLYAAIMLYTSNAIYRDLNQALRDENRTKLKKYFRYLRLFFESMGCLPKKKVNLWRGLSVDLHENPQYQVGQTVTWWGVSSCTADINVAKNFAKGCGGKCTVVTVESETASDISQITFYSNEKESLLAPGTQLKVKSNKRNGNITEITLKEVGRAIE